MITIAVIAIDMGTLMNIVGVGPRESQWEVLTDSLFWKVLKAVPDVAKRIMKLVIV